MPCPQGRPHTKIKIPAAACPQWLTDKSSCDGSCNLLHDRWGVLIAKINSGEISSAKAKKPRKDVTPTGAAPTIPPAAQTTRGGRGGRGGGRGRGHSASNTALDPSVPTTDAQQTQQTSGKPAGNVATVCSRCAKAGHVFAECYASYHIDGTKLTSPKPAPVPEAVAKERAARYAEAQPEAKNINHIESGDQLDIDSCR